ncbi:MAG: hypothetical protein Q8Q54_04165 [Methylococcales bacterium]|nr:hypothetical protein [Methylococcales bacterium]MDP3330894.1 hypothetical protein [Methylococcaceae bacterium]MDP3838097.1 hypothetical protein [Methylococcales bacterium]
MCLKSRLAKLEQSKTKINPYWAEIQKMSFEEIRDECKRIEARIIESDCPRCPDCTTPEHCLEIERIMARLSNAL